MLSPVAVEANIEEGETRRVTVGEQHPEDQTASVEEGTTSHPLAEPALQQDGEDAAPLEEQSPDGAADARNKDEDDDDDDVTVIILDHSPDDAEGQRLTIAWTGEAGPAVEERRRSIMLRELQRVQRTSFLHFLILYMCSMSCISIRLASRQ